MKKYNANDTKFFVNNVECDFSPQDLPEGNVIKHTARFHTMKNDEIEVKMSKEEIDNLMDALGWFKEN